MKFGTGSNTERTQKYVRVKVQNDMRTSTHINKQISPIFNCVTPESVSLANYIYNALLSSLIYWNYVHTVKQLIITVQSSYTHSL